MKAKNIIFLIIILLIFIATTYRISYDIGYNTGFYDAAQMCEDTFSPTTY